MENVEIQETVPLKSMKVTESVRLIQKVRSFNLIVQCNGTIWHLRNYIKNRQNITVTINKTKQGRAQKQEKCYKVFE